MDVLEANTCTNVTCADYVNGVLVVGVHLEQTAHAFFLARANIVDVGTCLNLTAINAEEGQTTYIRIGCDLERKSSSLLVLIGLTCLGLAGLGVNAFDSGSVQR